MKFTGARLNRRYFWSGFALMAFGTIAAAKSYPWVLNGGFVLPWVLLHAARLHDVGKPGLWALGAVTAPLFLLIGLATLKPPMMVYGALSLLTFLAFAAFTLWLGIKPGDAGPNRFGSPPLGWRLINARRQVNGS